MDNEQNTLSGTVDNITYRNDENGYCVFELETESELVTVVGYIPQLCAGEMITVKGEFTVHPSYGDQFRADSFERKAPATESAILRYLSSGAIKGIGPVTANAIVEQFGDRTLEIEAGINQRHFKSESRKNRRGIQKTVRRQRGAHTAVRA